MRSWLAVVLLLPSLAASADPLPARPRIAIAPTFAVFETTTEEMVPTQPLRSSSDSDTTLGGTLSLGLSWRVRPWIDVGFAGHLARFAPIDDNSLSAMAIGPHVEIELQRFYVRADLGVGRISDSGYGSNGARGGAELGYATPVSSLVTAQLGLAMSVLATTWRNEGYDHADVRSRQLLLSAALNCSIVFKLD